MIEKVLEWKEQFVEDLVKYQEMEREQFRKKLRMNEIEEILEEGSAMGKFLYGDMAEEQFEQLEEIVSMKTELRELRQEIQKYDRYFLEHACEREYYTGLKKKDLKMLSTAQIDGSKKATYAIAYFLAKKNDFEGAIERLKQLYDDTQDPYAALRLAEIFEFRVIQHMGKPESDIFAKEAMKWYQAASADGQSMTLYCSESLERLQHVSEIQDDHKKQRRSSKAKGQRLSWGNRLFPVALCIIFFVVTAWQVSIMITQKLRYTGDGNIVATQKLDNGTVLHDQVFFITLKGSSNDISKLGLEGIYTLNFPENEAVIASNLYQNMKQVSSLTIPEGVVKIEAGAFKGCERLENLVLPTTLQYIEEGAFEGCISLKSVDGSKTKLKHISSNAFAGCQNLKEISLPVTCIVESDSFVDCKKNFRIDYPVTEQ